jgi:hypothetical protein
MSPRGKSSYTIGHVPQIPSVIRELEQRSIAAGMHREYVAALRKIIDKLQNEPLQWGDPEYDFNKPGACVCHGICDPLFVQYAVFEEERTVIIMKIKPLPPSELA